MEYEGRDMPSKKDVFSVVRSCSQGGCVPHMDNCTDTLKTNPGCMIRYCCDSHSLCNGVGHVAPAVGQFTWMVLVLVASVSFRVFGVG